MDESKEPFLGGRNQFCYCGSGRKYKKCHLEGDKLRNMAGNNKRSLPTSAGSLKKVSDKGMDGDLAKRLLFGMLSIRDKIYQGKEQLEFDKRYTPVFDNLREANYSRVHVGELLKEHIERIETGRASEILPETGQLNINEDIDLELNIAFKDFFIRGGMALSFLVRLASHLGYNIGFIYQDDKAFEAGIQKFLKVNPGDIFVFLADRIRMERSAWYGSFRDKRNEIEHEGWALPPLVYRIVNGKVRVIVSKFDSNRSIEEGLEALWTRLMEFCEDMVALLLATKLPEVFSLMHIPKDKRDPKNPVRYQVVISPHIQGQIN